MDLANQNVQRGRPVSTLDAAKANDYFEHFVSAGTLKTILGTYRHICDLLHLKPNVFPLFYPKLKANLTSWKPKALWKKFDARANHKCYARGKLCPNTRVLVIGAGPCGLRTAIEAQLLGAKVVVIEKRDRISRNNVLHLWPFVIEDLRALGAKKFFGKFCAGAIDHISIRQLQVILLKVALLLGVEIHTEVSFEKLVEPNGVDKIGWRAEFKPFDHPVSQYEFDVIIGADGKRNTLQGFKRKEFRGKLAIAITANFINKRTEAEARVQEISGVAFIFNQKFFKDLNADTGIDLENIVYYKDDTHYFVMTAKKPSLIDKGVIKQDYADTARLLSLDNVDKEALMNYAREAADFSTNYQMPDLEFAVNHYGQPDVAMFDFTSMYAAENASKVIERHGYKLLMTLVGDSLLEPFWPTGSGCARGFLSSLDACWAIRAWGSGTVTPLEVLAERESIYRLLAQTTPENLNKDCKSYTVDPSTRYPNLNKNLLLPQQVLSLYDADDQNSIEFTPRTPQVLNNPIELHRKRRRRDIHADPNMLLIWIKEQIRDYEDLTVDDITTSFKDGRVLCAILHHYRPDLLDYSAISCEDAAKNNQHAFDLLEKEIGIPPVMTGAEMASAEVPDYLTMLSYLTQIYDTFRGEIPHIKHPKLSTEEPLLNNTKCVVATTSVPLSMVPLSSPLQSSSNKCKVSRDICLHNELILTPIKSIEDYDCNSDYSLNKEISHVHKFQKKLGKVTFSNLSAIHFENTINELELSDISTNWHSVPAEEMNLKYYDENFTELNVNPIKSESNSHCKSSHKFRKVCTPMTRLNTFLEANETVSLSSTTDSFRTNIIIRHFEEDDGDSSVTKQKHNYQTTSDKVFVNSKVMAQIKNSIHPKKYWNFKNQVCDWKTTNGNQKRICHGIKETDFWDGGNYKFLLMADVSNQSILPRDQTFEKVVDWISNHDFTSTKNKQEDIHQHGPVVQVETNIVDTLTDITSVTNEHQPNGIQVEMESNKIFRMSELMKKKEEGSSDIDRELGWKIYTDKPKYNPEPPKPQALVTIYEKEETELSESKRVEKEMPKIYIKRDVPKADIEKKISGSYVRPSETVRPKRHIENVNTHRFPIVQDQRRPKKRRSVEKFATCLERDRLPNQTKGSADEDFAARIKDLEDKWRDPVPAEKKPKDLLRAIGKIETSDWNIKEIEKKIQENKLGKSVNKEKEKVPKWNREQFLARQTKMEKKHIDRQDSAEAKFSELDKGIKRLEQRLKEGSVRDPGKNRVATITEKLAVKSVEPETKSLQQKSNSKPAITIPTQSASEYCHFCQKRVYLMERLSAEGKFFHRGCFKCQYCQTTLRLGSYLFDKDGRYGYRFYCSQHYGMPGELHSNSSNKKYSQKMLKENTKLLDKKSLIGVSGVDLLDRVQTPERIEFANLSADHISSDHDESYSQMDEDEWTDKNFGASTAEVCSSDDDDSSSFSGSESDNEDAYEEALEEPPTKEGTLRLMELCKQRYSRQQRGNEDSDSDDYSSSSDHSSYYENSSEEDEEETATEGEEEIRARELRKQEVRVEPPVVVQTDTGSDTEIVSDESSTESSSKDLNSATEVSTDSEFALDEPTPTREVPSIMFNDSNVTKTRGSHGHAKKVQVKSGVLQSPINGKPQKQGIKLEFTPLVPSPVLPKPAPTSLLARNEGYALNRTQSTGGIATKVSLELKKKYLLGDSGIQGNIQKSGSVSTLDSKFKSFHTNISDCQKMLKPASEISPSMQVFCNQLNERKSPLSPILSQSTPLLTETSKSPDIAMAHKDSQLQDENVLKPLNNTADKDNSNIAKKECVIFELESDCRPRSPVQEIPIAVPKINWNENKITKRESDAFSDSLTSDSDSDENVCVIKSPTVNIFNNIPRLEVHDESGEVLGDDIMLDSLCVNTQDVPLKSDIISSLSEYPKSIASEKKSLNQPKILPSLQQGSILSEVHSNLHEKLQNDENLFNVNAASLRSTETTTPAENDNKFMKSSSGQSTPPSDRDSCAEPATTALTETELSDWAHDALVSDDFEDVEFESNPVYDTIRRNKKPKKSKNHNSASIDAKYDDVEHICGRDKLNKEFKNISMLNENLGSLNSNLGSIEFMDTGVESSSEENGLVEAANRNNGYVQLQNEDDIAEDSLSPCINQVMESVNPSIQDQLNFDSLSTPNKNTGYCIIADDDGTNFGSEVIDLKPTDLEKLKAKQSLYENEEDSLLIIEPGTTTEENTCSDSTVKNVTEKVPDKTRKELFNVRPLLNENQNLIEKIRNEQKQASNQQKEYTGAVEQKTKESKTEENYEVQQTVFNQNKLPLKLITDINIQSTTVMTDAEYEEHCQRLQSKVEFGNVRDSIDVRKSKRKEKLDGILKPDLIQEEKDQTAHTQTSPSNCETFNLSSSKLSGSIYKKQEIAKERDENQRLVQEMVMNKMKAQNKSLERKKRNRNSFSPSLSPYQPYSLSKSATTDIATELNYNDTKYDRQQDVPFSTASNSCLTPDVVLSLNKTLRKQLTPLDRSPTSVLEFGKNGLVSSSPDPDGLPRSDAISDTPVLFKNHPKTFKKQLGVHSSFITKPRTHEKVSPLPDTPLTNPEAYNLMDLQNTLYESFKTPKTQPMLKSEQIERTAEKMKEDARARVRLKSDEDLGLSPEDKLKILRQKINNRGKKTDISNVQQHNMEYFVNKENQSPITYSNDTLTKKRNNSFKRSKSGENTMQSFSNIDLSRKMSLSKESETDVDHLLRTLSVTEFPKEPENAKSMDLNKSTPSKNMQQLCKSDPNLLTDNKREKKKHKDRERRKSITKFISELFGKKKENSRVSNSTTSKSFLARISPKSKDKSKQKITVESTRRKSFSENSLQPRSREDASPPPIPPLPLHYVGDTSRVTDDSSDGEHDWRHQRRSSCDTLDNSAVHDSHRTRSARKVARQARLKRHRLAQEIQRKLEETEVKTRELEQRGVLVEKALRGEIYDETNTTDESELLKEWFDLMRDLTELRRYERELMVRGQEVELEDRHARLQQELRERLENDEHKTKKDVETESSIINEMMEIVAKRDSLIALLEEDRLRCLFSRRGSAPQLETISLYSHDSSHISCPLFASLFVLIAYLVLAVSMDWYF